jgi:hypothetical protein
MGSATSWVIYLITGSIGMAYFVYGKKQKNFMFLLVGLGLCGYPYFVADPYLLVGVGTILIMLPFIIPRV